MNLLNLQINSLGANFLLTLVCAEVLHRNSSTTVPIKYANRLLMVVALATPTTLGAKRNVFRPAHRPLLMVKLIIINSPNNLCMLTTIFLFSAKARARARARARFATPEEEEPVTTSMNSNKYF